MRDHGVKRNERTTIPSTGILLAAILLAGFAGASVAEESGGRGTPTITIQDVFEADGILDAALHRTLAQFEAAGPDPVVGAKFTYFVHSCRGAKFWGYCNPALADPCDCECGASNPCANPTEPPVTREDRLTVEIWLPNNIDFAKAPVLMVTKIGQRGSDEYLEKVFFSRTLAKKGIPALIFSEEDLHPVDADPVPRIHEQLGYNGAGEMQQAAKVWLMTRDPANLTVEDFRFDDRFLNAQLYMLAVTFFERRILDWFDSDPAAAAWLDMLTVLYGGGSKGGGGAISAAGLDPRAAAIRVSNFIGSDDTESAGGRRYGTDWQECPDTCPLFDPCSIPSTAHRWAPWSHWSYRFRDVSSSYFDIYKPARDEARYEHLLYVEIAGTHDWINPLGSHSKFWWQRDGLVAGVPDPSESQWNFRLFRRINRDHGVRSQVGATGGGRPIYGDDLLLWHTMRHLAKNKPLPRIDVAGLDVSGDPGVDPWIVRVRVSETKPGHDPATEEDFRVHIAFSDDRDFRRCVDPIVCRPEGTPCSENGVCRDPDWDDNVSEEDKFIEVTGVQSVVDGEFRDLIFFPPPEAQAFATPPMIAVIVEGRLEGGLLTKIHDDWVLSTEVVFANTGSYPPYECCPE